LNENKPVLFFPHGNSTSLSFDPKGKHVAVTSYPGVTFPTDICNGTLSLFNIEEQSWEQLAAYEYNIDNVKFSPDGRYVAFQKDEIGEWGIQLIDLTTNNTFSITDGTDRIFTNVVIDYAFDPQSNYIALSNGAYGTEGHAFWGISLWRLSDQTLQARTEGSILAADLTFTETDSSIMFVKYDTEVSVWNYNTGVIASLNKPNETVGDNLHRLSFSNPPTYLLGALLDDWHPGDRMLFVWDIQSGKQVFFRDMPEDSFTDLITINPTGEYIAYSSTVDERRIVDLWEQTTGSSKNFNALLAATPTPVPTQ
jgi:WD40 repeat protein